jgi:hypothetical protein
VQSIYDLFIGLSHWMVVSMNQATKKTCTDAASTFSSHWEGAKAYRTNGKLLIVLSVAA